MGFRRDWADMTTEDFAAANPARWVAVLPVAAIEQHGAHLPLGTDAFIAAAYLAEVRELLPPEAPVLFLPVQSIGTSMEHSEFRGTVSLTTRSMIRLVTETGESVRRAGLTKIVIVTSHGGNIAAIDLSALDLRVRFGMLAVTTAWHLLGYPEGLFAADEIADGIHGGEIETSIILAARPDLVRSRRLARFDSAVRSAGFKRLGVDKPASFAWMAQDLNPSGTTGDASRATAEKGKAALAHGARAFVELLREVERYNLTGVAGA